MTSSRVALVTGASSGIGADTALLLAKAGFTVYAAARRADRMQALASTGIGVLSMDVTDEAAVTAAVEKITAEAGPVEVLVNNAGYGSYGPVEDVPIAEARRQFDVNVFGLARLIQLVVPAMRERGSGRLINVSSIGGKIYEPLGGWYHATKFAVEGLSDSLRVELRPFGIRVVLIEPGPIRTEWSAIARQNMLRTSAGTAYEGQARSVGRMLETADRPLTSSGPKVVARKIVKAATVAHPRARYPVGRGAGSIVRARRLLPDSALDAIIARAFGS
ncbi:MAG TPA: oxidoreductase [Streptosporangiaceae bacterium]|jgi:NAD(P)-dependent dehydrogenase (short-subunit alcohol dehydrogenase family)